jgi:hypothetical protein
MVDNSTTTPQQVQFSGITIPIIDEDEDNEDLENGDA